jgi:DNA-directed RNA polymerase specialized sigma24 family protein
VSDSPPGHPSSADFPTTQWSRVLAAGDRNRPEATEALCALCRDYWYPLYAFVRRKGYHAEDAQDLVRGFFAALLERNALQALVPERGRFRSFLMACCENYLGEHRAHQHALKRGGGRTPVSIDRDDAKSRFSIEPSDSSTLN